MGHKRKRRDTAALKLMIIAAALNLVAALVNLLDGIISKLTR
jgi:hypothetical protein